MSRQPSLCSRQAAGGPPRLLEGFRPGARCLLNLLLVAALGGTVTLAPATQARTLDPLPNPTPQRPTGRTPGPLETDDMAVSARIAAAWRVFFDQSPEAALPRFRSIVEEAPNRPDAQKQVNHLSNQQ